MSELQRAWPRFSVNIDCDIVEVTLTSEDGLNRFDEVLHTDFAEFLASLRFRTDIRAMVLTSEGNIFSAGGDFDLIQFDHDDLPSRRQGLDVGRRIIESFLEVPFPVVVGLKGAAVGLGASVALLSDIIVASKSAQLSDPHVTIGLVAGDGGTLLWPQAIGMPRAKRYLLTGDRIKAEDAYRMGLITDLVDEPNDVSPAAHALARRVAALPPLAVQGTKRVLNRSLQQRYGETGELAFSLEERTISSDDLIEAVNAFKERRVGTYQGR